jgi:carbonic anhydrase
VKAQQDQGSWNYESEGPDVWAREYPGCSGSQQSPINIITDNVVFDPSLNPINFLNYDQDIYWNMSNDGRTSN